MISRTTWPNSGSGSAATLFRPRQRPAADAVDDARRGTIWNKRQRQRARAAAVQSQGEPGKTVQPSTRSSRARGAPGCGAGCRAASIARGAAAGWLAARSEPARCAAEPGQELPVAADPAMLAAGVGVVPGREVVEELGVAEQAAARVVPLDQVVAEDVVLGKRRSPVAASKASTS